MKPRITIALPHLIFPFGSGSAQSLQWNLSTLAPAFCFCNCKSSKWLTPSEEERIQLNILVQIIQVLPDVFLYVQLIKVIQKESAGADKTGFKGKVL